MGSMRMLAISGVMLTVSTAGAFAADMPGNAPITLPPPARVLPVQRPVETYSGWYLRGDLGYRLDRMGGTDALGGFPATIDNKLGNSIDAGLGVGIKTDWMRTDVTVDFGNAMKYEGTAVTPGDTTAKVTAITALFNGYLDLGSWYGATPYIGAGAGLAQLRTSDYASTAAPALGGDLSHSQWNFAWAAMVGVGYIVAPNLMVDVGYRYVHFGDVTTGGGALGSMTLKDLAAHEVRVGLRWSFDDFPTRR